MWQILVSSQSKIELSSQDSTIHIISGLCIWIIILSSSGLGIMLQLTNCWEVGGLSKKVLGGLEFAVWSICWDSLTFSVLVLVGPGDDGSCCGSEVVEVFSAQLICDGLTSLHGAEQHFSFHFAIGCLPTRCLTSSTRFHHSWTGTTISSFLSFLVLRFTAILLPTEVSFFRVALTAPDVVYGNIPHTLLTPFMVASWRMGTSCLKDWMVNWCCCPLACN